MFRERRENEAGFTASRVLRRTWRAQMCVTPTNRTESEPNSRPLKYTTALRLKQLHCFGIQLRRTCWRYSKSCYQNRGFIKIHSFIHDVFVVLPGAVRPPCAPPSARNYQHGRSGLGGSGIHPSDLTLYHSRYQTV